MPRSCRSPASAGARRERAFRRLYLGEDLPMRGSSGSNAPLRGSRRNVVEVSRVPFGVTVMKKLALLSVSLLLATACSKSYIPNTDVEDSSDNRKVITFCEQYRHAVEDKDVGTLLKMASPRYYEDGGNTNAEDDIDYDGLKDYLTASFVKTQTIRYEIRYRK